MPASKLQTEPLQPVPLTPLPDRPLVSILMSNHNYSSYLRDAIESCLQQSYEHFELIVCDDGSTDESLNIVKHYQSLDRRIRAIFQGKAGQAVALNAAFSESTGEIVCLLDSDDVFASDKLQCVVNAFRAAPGSGLLVNRMLRVDGTRKYLGRIPALYQLPSGWHGPFLFRSGPRMMTGLPPTSGLSLRRPVAKVVFPLPCCLKTCADTVIHYLGPLITPVVSITRSLGEYRIHESNAQARARFTEDRIRQLVLNEKEIWYVWHRYLASMSSVSFSGLPVPLNRPPSLLSYAYARFLSDQRSREIYEAIPTDFFRTLPSPYRWYWRVSVLLPNWLFRESFNLLYGQTRTKIFVGRILKAF